MKENCLIPTNIPHSKVLALLQSNFQNYTVSNYFVKELVASIQKNWHMKPNIIYFATYPL